MCPLMSVYSNAAMADSTPAAARGSLADLLVQRIRPLGSALAQSYREAGPINHFVVDDTFPEPVARLLAERFPAARDMMRRSTIRESKYVSSQMDRHDPLLEEATFAFQDRRFVALLSEITAIADLAADPVLYASGLSLMRQGDFLHPHLDNSHDKDRERYRVLNVLYYVTPDWALDCGGNLELWEGGPDGAQRTIESRFNRLVCMTTHRGSWHSVSPVRVPRERTCVSNYYFSGQPLGAGEYFHVTSFRGRPEQGLRDLVLRVDTMLRAALRRVYRKGVVAPKHVYKKSSDSRL
jgi:Rps23 Pro-64 3,4-dihydroxylase Tpa1-like proline 4-hydroxylase